MMWRQVHVEITRIEGTVEPLGGIATPARLRTDLQIDGHEAWMTGALQAWGPLYIINSILKITAETDAEIRDKIRASWRDLRILFTGYNAAHIDSCGVCRHQEEVT